MKDKIKIIGIFACIFLLGLVYIGPQKCASIATAAQKNILKGTGTSTINEEGLSTAVFYDYLYYGSIKELSEASNAIIKGEIFKVYDPQVMVTAYVVNSDETYKDVYTVSDVKVTESIKGSLKPGDIIKVRQLGGYYKGTDYKKYGPEFLSPKMTGVLFLMTFDDGPSELINPGQGMVKLVNGKTNIADFDLDENHISASGEDLDSKLFKNDMDEKDLIKLIKESF
jgi:hypothetical protein